MKINRVYIDDFNIFYFKKTKRRKKNTQTQTPRYGEGEKTGRETRGSRVRCLKKEKKEKSMEKCLNQNEEKKNEKKNSSRSDKNFCS